MLNDRADCEGPERSIAWSPVSRPPGAGTAGAVHRGPETEHVRDPPHDELVLEIVEAIQVLEDEPELPHQRRVLEVLLQVRVELGDEQGIVLRERGDECRIEGEVVLLRMAGATRAPVAGERLVEEEVSSLADELARTIDRRRSDRAAGQRHDCQEHRWNAHESGAHPAPFIGCRVCLLTPPTPVTPRFAPVVPDGAAVSGGVQLPANPNFFYAGQDAPSRTGASQPDRGVT